MELTLTNGKEKETVPTVSKHPLQLQIVRDHFKR